MSLQQQVITAAFNDELEKIAARRSVIQGKSFKVSGSPEMAPTAAPGVNSPKPTLITDATEKLVESGEWRKLLRKHRIPLGIAGGVAGITGAGLVANKLLRD
jgi:hypothetical protein